MASIANLIVSMIADTGQFDTDIKRTSKQTAAEMKKMEQSVEKTAKVIGAAFAAAATAATVLVVKAINAADNIRDLSLKTGIGTEALSEYSYATAQAGTTIDAFVFGVNKMQKSLIAAAEGGKTQSAAFDRLGLSVEELLKLSPDKQFEAIADKISQIGNAAEKTAVSQAIFGKGAAALAPLMAEGAAGILEARAEMERFGNSISEEFAADADQFEDNMTAIKAIGSGITNQFTAGLLPALISIQTEFIRSADGADAFKSAGESLGEVIIWLTRGFTLLWGLLQTLASGLIGIAATAQAALMAVLAPIKATLSAMADASEQIAHGEFRAAWETLGSIVQRSGSEFNQALADMKHGVDEVAGAGIYFQEALEASNRLLAESKKHAEVTAKEYENLGYEASEAGDSVKSLEAAAKRFLITAKNNKKEIEAHVKVLEDEIKAQAEYNEKLQDFIDVGDPVGALMREFALQLEFANDVLAKSPELADAVQRSLNALSDQLGKTAAGMQETAEESDAMTEAMLEGVRILERTFTDLWTGILDGSVNAFEGILDGFKTLLAQMLHNLLTAPLIKELEKVLSPEGGGLGSLNLGSLAGALGGIAGVGLGGLLGGGGQNAGLGSGVGALIGQLTIPIPGLGAALGGIIGGLLGGLFDKKKTPTVQASGFNNFTGKGTNISFDDIFGETFLHTRHVDSEAVEAFKQSIIEFDEAIGSFLDDNQIGAISEALEKFNSSMAGDAISIEQLLGDRFDVILSTFSDTLQDFVNDAADLEEKIGRLQVGVGAEKLFADQPDLFGTHTVKEFLAVVDAFKDGTETITDAFNEVLILLATVQTATDSLKDFSSSDLGADFAALLELQGESVVATLTRLTSGLSDAITNFDGSPEQLVEIGNLAMSVRQQELTALSLIDSVQKGLNANLDRLLADTTELIKGPRKAEEILFDARALIDAVSKASTPEDIAQIGQQFEELIRSLDPEDTKAFGTSTLAIIEAFQAASNTALEQAKQSILDSGEAIRDMVDGFAAMIDPLEVIASSNERAAAALEAIAGGTTNQAVSNTDTLNETFQQGLTEQTNVLADGVNQMSNALSNGAADMAGQIVNAVRSGFAGANVTVNVVVQEQGLVTV